MTSQNKENKNVAMQHDPVVPGFIVAASNVPTKFLSIREIMRIFGQNKLLILMCVLLTGILAAALAFYLPQKYRSEVVLSQVASNSSSSGLGGIANQFSGLASLAGVSLTQEGDARQVLLATLRSRSFTLDFIEKYSLRPLLFSDRWDQDKQQWDENAEIPSNMESFKKFDKIRGVVDDKATSLIKISITWTDRALAAEWANRLVEELNQHMKYKAVSEAEQSKRYLEAELVKTSMFEMRALIFGLIESQVNQVMLANVRDQYSLSTIDAAVVADEGEYSTPSRLLMILAGCIAGLSLGLLLAVVKCSFNET